MGRRLLAAGCCGVALSVAIAAPASAQRPTKTVVRLTPLPGGYASGAWDINDSGVAVGWSNNATTSRAVKWTLSAVTELGHLTSSTGSGAEGINNNGVVVGYSSVSGSNMRATKWAADGTASELPSPVGLADCRAEAINDSGVAVGNCRSGNKDNAVRWAADGTPTILETPLALTGIKVTSINAEGVAAGWVRREVVGQSAVRWSADNHISDVATPNSSENTEALGINDRGQISGWQWRDSTYNAVRWDTDGTTKFQSTLPGTVYPYSRGYDVNNGGVVVGDARSADNRYVAARWNADGTATRLPSLPDAASGTIDFATSINNSGAIAGSSGANAVLWLGFH